MTTYFGNCNHLIDWDEVIRAIEAQDPAFVGPRHRVGDNVPGVNEVVGPLIDAGHVTRPNGGSAGWDMFLPKTNFDESVVYKFAEFVGLESYTNAWIARVLPGHMAPWHWDITDDEATLSRQNFSRYHCHIQKPINGHMLVVEDHFHYGREQGDTYKWPDRKSWHCGANCGYEPWYTFHFWH